MNWFKNLRIKSKLISSFAIVIVFSIILALLANFTVNSIDDSYTYLLNFPQKRFEYLMRVDSNCTTMRQATTALVLNVSDSEKVKVYWDQFEQAYNDAVDNVNKYLERNNADTVRDDATIAENVTIVTNMKKLLEGYRANAKKGMETALATGDADAVNPIFLEGGSSINGVVDTVKDLLPKATAYINEISEANTRDKNAVVFTLYIVLAIIVILSAIIALYISALISKPLQYMSRALDQIGTKGDLTLDDETSRSARECSELNDEIGTCAKAAGGLIQRLTEVGKTLETIAAGDLTAKLSLLSENDIIGQSLHKMTGNLNQMFAEINATSSQVSSGSGQVASGSQTLAQGSTEQASAVEELSASISEVADKTKQNADMAGKAAALSMTIKSNAEKGNTQMNQLMQAVTEINEASQSISKVIKVIDDIAFQTNILALNAAVEAARAGQHGKGFAVVADEVRNLAAKSAASAKDTGSLIENSIGKSNLGLTIATETTASLQEIVSGINHSAEIVAKIAQSSDEQTLAIAQIDTGIEQVTQVIQQNSATAEESAAASKEMSDQAMLLQELIKRFKLNDDNMAYRSNDSQLYHQLESASDNAFAGLGKY